MHHFQCKTCLGVRVDNTWCTVCSVVSLAHRTSQMHIQDVVYPFDHLQDTAGVITGKMFMTFNEH